MSHSRGMRAWLIFGLLSLLACPTTGATDGGLDGSGDASLPDAGPDDGGGGGDGGTDAGCTLPGCTPCEQGGELCDGQRVCDPATQVCVTACVAGSTRCSGVKVETCGADRLWSAEQSCALGTLCTADECSAPSACAAQVPACCALPEDCGTLSTPFTCQECRSIVRNEFCIAGACEDELAVRVDFTLRADASALDGAVRLAIESGMVTIYRGISSDGTAVTCRWVLDDASGPSPHDAQDPRLNATLSRYFNYTGGTGNDIFDALLLGIPQGPGQTIVLTMYDRNQGRGFSLARGCVENVEPVMGQLVLLTLAP